jgi:hypothetical protein
MSRLLHDEASAPTAVSNAPPGLGGFGMQLHAEWQRFVVERMRKDLETWARLVSCGSLAEMACVQFEANADLASDYLDEMNRFLGSMAGSTTSSAAPGE